LQTAHADGAILVYCVHVAAVGADGHVVDLVADLAKVKQQLACVDVDEA